MEKDIRRFYLNFSNQEIEIIRDYDPSIPEINGDENLFVQAILNIVMNAQQALKSSENPCVIIDQG